MITTLLFWDYLQGRPGVYMLWFASKNSFINESMVVNNPMTPEWQADSIAVHGPYVWGDLVARGNTSIKIYENAYPGTRLDYYKHFDSSESINGKVP